MLPFSSPDHQCCRPDTQSQTQYAPLESPTVTTHAGQKSHTRDTPELAAISVLCDGGCAMFPFSRSHVPVLAATCSPSRCAMFPFSLPHVPVLTATCSRSHCHMFPFSLPHVPVLTLTCFRSPLSHVSVLQHHMYFLVARLLFAAHAEPPVAGSH
jgi:hypothetical protein